MLVLLCLVTTASRGEETVAWQAGTAKLAITPDQPMWMSGYAARTGPARGKVHDLWCKALVLQDPRGQRVAAVTLDLVGIDRDVSLAIRRELEQKYQLGPAHCALLCSHTHSGPVVGENLMPMYFLDEQQARLVAEYTVALRARVVEVVGRAIRALAPVELRWGSGTAGFAVNRRNNPEADVPKLRAAGSLRGPTDHEVPVLAVHSPQGGLRAVLFGYACHATVLDGYQWCGDYPGFAQAYLEQDHPGAVALFFAGCGADQNPIPRRNLELAERYGRELADAVNATLAGGMQAIAGELAVSYREIPLSFAQLPDRQQLLAAANSDNRYEASRAKLLLSHLQARGVLNPDYPYPVEAWRLGTGPLWVLLGGEVVVDYALRLKHELGPSPLWVAGYANDVMAYIPSRRVLEEGGYEGGGAMVYYGLPSAWDTDVEERIVRDVRQQVTTLPAPIEKP
jgi:hypothetical protein